jgi:hypothetical protein
MNLKNALVPVIFWENGCVAFANRFRAVVSKIHKSQKEANADKHTPQARSAHSSAGKQTRAADFFHGCDCFAGSAFAGRAASNPRQYACGRTVCPSCACGSTQKSQPPQAHQEKPAVLREVVSGGNSSKKGGEAESSGALAWKEVAVHQNGQTAMRKEVADSNLYECQPPLFPLRASFFTRSGRGGTKWKEVAVHQNGQTAMRKEVRSEKRYEVKRGTK